MTTKLQRSRRTTQPIMIIPMSAIVAGVEDTPRPEGMTAEESRIAVLAALRAQEDGDQ